MTAFEYCVASLPAADPAVTARRLGEYGAQGWELVFVAQPSTVKNQFVYPVWFKRAVAAQHNRQAVA